MDVLFLKHTEPSTYTQKNKIMKKKYIKKNTKNKQINKQTNKINKAEEKI